MDKPCRYCKKALPKLSGEPFEQECGGTCEKYKHYADGVSKGLKEMFSELEMIKKKHQN